MKMEFSLKDFQTGLAEGRYAPPAVYQPFMQVSPKRYYEHEQRHQRLRHSHVEAFQAIRKRMDPGYYSHLFPLQARALDYSQLAFPAYKFILPEVIADDWLGMVGWHKHQRDHVLHLPLTAYVVLKLLRGDQDNPRGMVLPDGCALLDRCIEEVFRWEGTAYLRQYLLASGLREDDYWLKETEPSRNLWKALFVESAYLAALFHDIGYPRQYVNLLDSHLEHTSQAAAIRDMCTSDLFSRLGRRLVCVPFNGYRVAGPDVPANWRTEVFELMARAWEKTHGFPGAISFLHLNDGIRDYPADPTHPIRRFCVEWAAMAILMHDMGGIYRGGSDATTPPQNPHLRLRLEVDPLSYVVALADVLQDFARPAVSFDSTDCDVRLTYGRSSSRVELDLNDSSAVVTYCFEDPAVAVIKQKHLSKEVLEYFHAQYGYLDLGATGIGKVDMKAEGK